MAEQNPRNYLRRALSSFSFRRTNTNANTTTNNTSPNISRSSSRATPSSSSEPRNYWVCCVQHGTTSSGGICGKRNYLEDGTCQRCSHSSCEGCQITWAWGTGIW